MVAEIGHFALALALGLALATIAAAVIGHRPGRDGWLQLVAPLARAGLIAVTIALMALVTGYVTSDFSILNVWQNSHTAKPLLYKITGAWGNHEGSMLLWVWVLQLYAAFVPRTRRLLDLRMRAKVLAVQAAIAAAFLLFILAASNPFLRLDPAPLEGRGLNPLLQDPGLAFHPPLLYLGYVGFSIVYAFAAAALIAGRMDAIVARAMRPFALAAFSALTLGIGLGSWWAYYELGWGGFWFWDPVENASFIPWLAGAALIHSLVVTEKRGALARWTLVLATITFALALLGTFLVRSGVLTSVHAFAVDPRRGLFILAILTAAIVAAFALLAWRAPLLERAAGCRPVSREGAMMLNNVLLAVAAAVVLVGTLYPLALEALTGEKISVGAPYFVTLFGPLAVILLALVVVAPHLRWKRDAAGRLAFLLPRAGLGALAALAAVAAAFGLPGVLAALAIALAGALIASALAEWRRAWPRTQGRRSGLREALRRIPLNRHAYALAHLGLAVTVIGVVAAESFATEKTVLVEPGAGVEVAGRRLVFEGLEPAIGPNYTAVAGLFRLDGPGGPLLDPARRSYWAPPMETTEAAIRPTPLGDIYLAIGARRGDAVELRASFKPLVALIWLGALLMATGGLLALVSRVRLAARRVPAREENAS
ncbi:MAG: c-type cytochrome biogenesis protein CcmF [Rhodothalassiaceae bacterium]|nr:MAG: c-type cytochrome biogenesis protein CcmF [Rhodothalassiaceae bacterium]